MRGPLHRKTIAPDGLSGCQESTLKNAMVLSSADMSLARQTANAVGSEVVIYPDPCRKFHPNRLKSYTVWNMKTNARPRNHGSRVDFILAATGQSSSTGYVNFYRLCTISTSPWGCRSQPMCCTPTSAC